MCADIEIVTSNQYDGASAAHSELDRPAPRLRSALPRPHVRVDGSPLHPQNQAAAAAAAAAASGAGLPFRQTCSWMDRHGRPASPPMEYGGRRSERRDR